MKIDIKIKNLRKYALVAFLVDREDFLKDIEDVRKHIKLLKFPYVFPRYSYSEANRLADFYKKGLINLNGARELLEEFCAEKGLLNLYALDEVLAGAVMFAKSLTIKYNKNRLYTPSILASILTARIENDDFLSTQMYEINRKVVREELAHLGKEEEIITIRVNRESTATEVKQTFDFIQKYYFKIKKTEKDDRLLTIYENISDGKPPDTSENIKRDRDWYWLKKEGWSYQQIRKECIKKNNDHIILRGIELAIKRYSGKLK